MLQEAIKRIEASESESGGTYRNLIKDEPKKRKLLDMLRKAVSE